MVMTVFFFASRLRRLSPSFPTRRSSDLQWRWLEHAAWVIFEDVFLVMSCVRGLAEMRQTAERTHDMTRNTSSKITQDRKSTRLNSSHAKISYAVFCLKKKKL